MRTPVVVLITTYRRPDGLRRLLQSLALLNHADPRAAAPAEPRPLHLDVSLLIVDNGPADEHSAVAAIVDHARCEHPNLSIRLVHEPGPGISFARNRALTEGLAHLEHISARDHARPPAPAFLAFVDDDERASPDWLLHLVRTALRFDADAVAGPVAPHFHTQAPPWLADSDLFARTDRPTGQPLPWAFTGNVLIRTAALRDFLANQPTAFDERLALVGSEDRHFFQRWTRAGRSLVWCQEALVEEDLPAERASVAWLAARKRRVARAACWIERDLHPAPALRLKHAALGAAWTLRGLARYAIAFPRGPIHRARARIELAWGLGRLLGSVADPTPGYRNTD